MTRAPAKTPAQPGRVGMVPVTGHFTKDVRDQLKIMAVEQSRTMQQLLGEALDDLFAKYGRRQNSTKRKS